MWSVDLLGRCSQRSVWRWLCPCGSGSVGCYLQRRRSCSGQRSVCAEWWPFLRCWAPRRSGGYVKPYMTT